MSRRLISVLAATLAAALTIGILTWLLVTGDGDSTSSVDDPTGTATTSGGEASPTETSTPSPGDGSTSPTTGSTTAPPAIKPIRASFGDDVDLGNGVKVDIVDIEAVEGKAGRPGEVGGPSVRFTVQVENRSGEAINLDLAIVNAYFGPDQSPATQLQEPGGVALPQVVPNGRTATGKYVFNIPLGERDQVKVEFVYTVESPMIIYTGAARG